MKKLIKKITNYKYITLIGITFIIILSLSYAYFSSILNDYNSNDIVTTTGSLSLRYDDGYQITMLNSYPGQSITKTIVVENNGTLEVNYSIYIDQIINIIEDNELVISGTCESNTDSCENILLQSVVQNGSQTLKGNVSISRDERHTYTLTIEFKEMNKNQNYNQGKNFSGRVQVEEYKYNEDRIAVINNATISNLLLTSTITDNEGVVAYCITDCDAESCEEWTTFESLNPSVTLIDIPVDDYDKTLWAKNVGGNIVNKNLTPSSQLTVLPSGGTWNSNTLRQIFPLNYKETKNIEDPTRVGYTFLNWSLSGERSTLDNKLFAMGIEDSNLTAMWDANEYTLTIKPNGGTWEGYTLDKTINVDFESTVSLPNPTRNGYTFTGWTLSNNTNCVINGESLIMGLNGCTVSANWQSSSLGEICKNQIMSTCFVNNYTNDNSLISHSRQAVPNQNYAVTEYRYEGGQPNNYINFNNEVWRIIGIFETQSNSSESSKNYRLKLIRENPISTTTAWNTNGNSNWSSASLKNLFNNGDYYNRTNTYSSTGLSSTSKSMISDAYWYLGGGYSDDFSGYYANTVYTFERSNNKYGSNPTTWIGKVGLMYASDYIYAAGNACYDNYNLGSTSNCRSYNWLRNTSYYEYILNVVADNDTFIPIITNNSYINHGYKVNPSSFATFPVVTRPVIYLNSNVKIIGGQGTSTDMYTIAIN